MAGRGERYLAKAKILISDNQKCAMTYKTWFRISHALLYPFELSETESSKSP